MADFYTVKLMGGRHEGIQKYPKATTNWPLPDEIHLDDGYYAKVSESQLPEGADDHPNVSRGAAYQWKALK
jgi:hypothetical protein